MRNWINLVEDLSPAFDQGYEDQTFTQEYQGQNAFVEKMRTNPRFLTRLVTAIKKLRSDFLIRLETEGYSEKLHRAATEIYSNYPHSDESYPRIFFRIGAPDWDNCDHDPEAGIAFAIKILNDAVDHPVDWDCIAGMAMRHLMGRDQLFD